MIVNPERIYQGCPPASFAFYKLRLIEHFILAPIAEEWPVTVTSAYRTEYEQANLATAGGGIVPASLKAKGISQHLLGEAVDIVTPDLKKTWLWILENLRPWQAILEWRTDPGSRCIHLSLPSERDSITSKRLLYFNGVMNLWTGRFPDEPPPRSVAA